MANMPNPRESYLAFLYYQLLGLSTTFRDSVCNECGWSEATFYRKARTNKGISNAELENIIKIFQQMIEKILSNVKDSLKDDL